jgi:hypothetical protein
VPLFRPPPTALLLGFVCLGFGDDEEENEGGSGATISHI